MRFRGRLTAVFAGGLLASSVILAPTLSVARAVDPVPNIACSKSVPAAVYSACSAVMTEAAGVIAAAESCANGSSALCNEAVSTAVNEANSAIQLAQACAAGSDATCNLVLAAAKGLAAEVTNLALACASLSSGSLCAQAVATARSIANGAESLVLQCVGGGNTACSTVEDLADEASSYADNCLADTDTCNPAQGVVDAEFRGIVDLLANAGAPLAHLTVHTLPDLNVDTEDIDYDDGSVDPVQSAYDAAVVQCASGAVAPGCSDAGPYPPGSRLHIDAILTTPASLPDAPLRTGWWPGGTSKKGFGRTKIIEKHNILYPNRLLQDCIGLSKSDYKVSTNPPRVRFYCDFYPNDGTTPPFTIMVGTNLDDSSRLADGRVFGVITAFCEGYVECPNAVNRPYEADN